MRDLPIVAKMIVNIILYVVYLLLASVIFSFLFPLVMQLFGQPVLSANDPVFDKIQIFIAILVLLLTLILRKYFYISHKNVQVIEHVEVEKNYVSDTASEPKKVKKTKMTKETVVDTVDEEEDDEIKIYVEKEIK